MAARFEVSGVHVPPERLFSFTGIRIDRLRSTRRWPSGCCWSRCAGKVGIACTQKQGFVVGIRSYPGNPYDGNTLDDLLEQTQILTETPVETIAVDLGYRGRHATKAKIIHRGKKLSRRQKARLRHCCMLEAMIGHMKNDGLLGRCFLAGTDGDAVHAILCGIGHNLRLLMAFLATLPFWLREICLVYLLQAASVPHRAASASPSR